MLVSINYCLRLVPPLGTTFLFVAVCVSAYLPLCPCRRLCLCNGTRSIYLYVYVCLSVIGRSAACLFVCLRLFICIYMCAHSCLHHSVYLRLFAFVYRFASIYLLFASFYLSASRLHPLSINYSASVIRGSTGK